MRHQNAPGPNAALDGGKARRFDRLRRHDRVPASKLQAPLQVVIPEATSTTCAEQSHAERLLDDAALALFASVHALCGAGQVRDRSWWALESERLGSNWPSILATVASAVELCRRRTAPDRRVA
jgi:hypothetical protein